LQVWRRLKKLHAAFKNNLDLNDDEESEDMMMPSGVHSIDLELPTAPIWEFVKVMDHWAPLVPGYISHEILSDRESTWSFKGDIGIMKKTVKLKVDITEWIEPTKVTFNLTGLSENFSGNGYFEAEPLEETRNRMTGCLNVTAKGAMGPMINVILKDFVPNLTKELTEAIANKIKDTAGIKF
jgi:carbon monoxide dehydrogenase subunit G